MYIIHILLIRLQTLRIKCFNSDIFEFPTKIQRRVKASHTQRKKRCFLLLFHCATFMDISHVRTLEPLIILLSSLSFIQFWFLSSIQLAFNLRGRHREGERGREGGAMIQSIMFVVDYFVNYDCNFSPSLHVIACAWIYRFEAKQIFVYNWNELNITN